MAQIPKANTSDMSIDELSAAIDAHMDDVKPTPPKPKEVQPTMDEKVEAAIKKVAETEIPSSKPSAKSSKIKVRKSGYISKAEDESKKSAISKKEPEGRIAAGKRDIKPITPATSTPKTVKRAKPLSPVETAELAKGKMVDVVVKTTESNAPKKTSVVPKSDQASPVPVKTESVPQKKTVATPTPVKKESPRVEAKPITPEPATKVEPKVETKPADPPKKNDSIDNLSAQIIEKKDTEKVQPKSDTLKTFDTKQYHIPIKPSRHHRAGSSFMVFAAVLAAILATVYVLNELEIIDLVELLYPN